jgi:hypothetical protein
MKINFTNDLHVLINFKHGNISELERIRVQIAVRFCERFAAKGLMVFILNQTPITTVCKHISE